MPINEIPARYEHVCDGCGLVYPSISKARPPHWSTLVIEREAYDFQGAACADATVRLSLCSDCTETVIAAVNTAISVRRHS